MAGWLPRGARLRTRAVRKRPHARTVRSRARVRALTVLSALLGAQLGLLVAVPAFACGCGALVAAGTPFLTAVDQEFPEPWRISGDHRPRRAESGTAFRQVIYGDRLTEVAGVPVWLPAAAGGLVLTVAAAAAPAGRRARHRRRAPRPPGREPDGGDGRSACCPAPASA
jgi:hypothetical protein